ncbi:MAG: DUF2993 domain-containing protein [Microcoleaceae cyanobacterium]
MQYHSSSRSATLPSNRTTDQSTSQRSHQWVSKVLSQAVQFWLKSQVEWVDNLRVIIEGKNRSILSGTLSRVEVSANQAIYQGIHLSQAQAIGSEIQLNLSQVLRGQPLRLTQRFPVCCSAYLSTEDLNASIQSSTLQQGLQDVLETLLRCSNWQPEVGRTQIQQLDLRLFYPTQMILGNGQITLIGQIDGSRGRHGSTDLRVALTTDLTLVGTNQLQLQQVQLQGVPNLPTLTLEKFSIDLGSDVNIQTFNLTPDQLGLQGQIWVNP